MLLNIKDFNILFWNLLALKDELLKPCSNDDNASIYSQFIKKSEKNKEKISLILDRFYSYNNQRILIDLVNNVEYSIIPNNKTKKEVITKEKKIEKVKYFHVSNMLINEKTKKIFEQEQKYLYYYIEELKEKNHKNLNSKELQIKNNIIKCKNFLSSILYNHRILEKNDFKKGTTNSIIDIL